MRDSRLYPALSFCFRNVLTPSVTNSVMAFDALSLFARRPKVEQVISIGTGKHLHYKHSTPTSG